MSRFVSLVFLTFIVIISAPPLNASADWPLIQDEEKCASHQPLTEFVESAHLLIIEDSPSTILSSTQHIVDQYNECCIRAAGECNAMKTTVAKLIQIAHRNHSKRYTASDNRDITQYLFTMINESIVADEYKMPLYILCTAVNYTEDMLVTSLNSFVAAENYYLGFVQPTEGMTWEDHQWKPYLYKRSRQMTNAFLEHCAPRLTRNTSTALSTEHHDYLNNTFMGEEMSDENIDAAEY